MKRLGEALSEGLILLDLEAWDIRSIFRQTLDEAVARGLLPPEHREAVESALLRREEQISTAIGHAVAVPHAYLDVFEEQVVVFARLAHPLNLGAPDGIPTRFVFVLLGPPGTAGEHLDMLTNIARLMSDEGFRYEAGEARTPEEVIEALDRFRRRTVAGRAVVEVGPVEGLVYTGRPLGGLIDDVRRRWAHYASDFRDGLHPKCVASVLFLYFAILAPTVAFGGLLAVLTDGQIGVVESLIATAVGGALYALLAGQPLTIIATTGPIAIFLGILYELCVYVEVPFLPTLGWIGLWTSLFVLLLVVFDVSWVVRFATRFTDEIFAALIALIYIYQSVGELAETVVSEFREERRGVALLSLLLGLGTFYIAMSLSRFRRSRYLLPQVREFLADFGPAIAIGSMTLVALWLRDVMQPESLSIGASFTPSVDRSWMVDLSAAPSWVRLASAVPALFATVLVFLDQQITARLVNSSDHRLQKGPGYHLDLAVVGALIGAFSLFGFPWLVAATVRSLNHVRSLATMEEVVSENADTRERIIHVRENRLTALTISLLIGLSLLLVPLLKTIPLAVLFGLFLYMGVVSTIGNQFFERLKLWLMDPALYPAHHYIRKVPMATIHKYTLVQLVWLVVLWVVRMSPAAILFPLLIALLVPVRFALGRFIPPEDLAALDSEEDPEEEETHWL